MHVRHLPLVGLVAVFVGVAMSAVGCSPREPIATLSGNVTFEGEPLADGLLVLSNEVIGVYITAEIIQGKFEVSTAKQGVPPGEYRVAITPPIVDHPIGPIEERPHAVKFLQIPERYRDEQTSGFAITLEDGKNTRDFAMTKS